MRRLRLSACMFLLAGIMIATPAAQERASFDGTWTAATNGQRLVIKQDAAQLTVTDGRGQVLVYKLDGSNSQFETTTVRGPKWSHVAQARWVSSALVVTTTTTRETGQHWDWMTIYRRDGQGSLIVSTLDAVTDPGPYMAMGMFTVEYKKAS